MAHPDEYIFQTTGVQLRPYQVEPIPHIMESIRLHLGLSFVIIFPRQSGKDEFLVNLKAYLLDLYSVVPVGIVEINPTYKPQTVTALMRFEQALSGNLLTRGKWRKRGDFMRTMGLARTAFLSGDASANVVGATASLLLIVNEAQDISAQIYGQKFEPMAASTNATRVFAGTVWTSDTLLAQQTRAAKEAEKDGRQRVFMVDATRVAKSVPWYGDHVAGVVKTKGRQHPLVKTQYFNEEIDAVTGMFPEARQVLMYGAHSARTEPEPGKIYAFLVDVAGQDEAVTTGTEVDLLNPGRDATNLKIVEIDCSDLALLGKPTYRTVYRQEWTGQKHTRVYGALCALEETWRPRWWVVDATGVGEGLWSLLDTRYPGKVQPIKFTAQTKSEIGYGFISIIETGRYREYHPFDDQLRLQLSKCKSEIVPGPAKLMRWGVPDGTRDDSTGELVHDDDVLTAAMTAILDLIEWHIPTEVRAGEGFDPLEQAKGF